jgi:oxygen-independent coproporphyrinogen III oxidase
MSITPEILARYAEARLPRYTSYPTAAQFSDAVGPAEYRAWLDAIAPRSRVSLYLHVPFCRSMCWYCGCHTAVTREAGPVSQYAGLLRREIDLVAAVAPPLRAGHLHFGGGTPTILAPGELTGLLDHLRARFEFEPNAEIAVEIDPRTLTAAMAAALGGAGVTRASLGVQSFDPAVQRAVNRVQSFGATARAADRLRSAGVTAINLDLIYGLPHQTVASCVETVRQALTLQPDRFAVFGYAHVPGFKPHQKKIDAAALPDAQERWSQSRAISELLRAADYVAIGFDHYARPEDALARAAAQGRLNRNFQGYTVDDCPVLLGFGASAIGRLPQGYVQNAVVLGTYAKRIGQGQLATAKGCRLTAEDELRAAVIERLMCDFRLKGGAEELVLDRHGLARLLADGLVHREKDMLVIPDDARPLVRTVAALFDAYLHQGGRRHAAAV